MRKSQSITEYAIFIAAIIMAFLAIKTYFARGYSGYAKKYTDSLGKNQYSPMYSNYDLIKESGSVTNGGASLGPSASSSQKGLTLTPEQRQAVQQETQNLYGLYDQWVSEMAQNETDDANATLLQMQTEKQKIDVLYGADYAGQAYTNTTNTNSQITRTIGGAVSCSTLASSGADFSELRSFGNSLSTDDGVTDVSYSAYKDFKDNFNKIPANYTVTKQGTVTDDFSGKKLSEDQLLPQ